MTHKNVKIKIGMFEGQARKHATAAMAPAKEASGDVPGVRGTRVYIGPRFDPAGPPHGVMEHEITFIHGSSNENLGIPFIICRHGPSRDFCIQFEEDLDGVLRMCKTEAAMAINNCLVDVRADMQSCGCTEDEMCAVANVLSGAFYRIPCRPREANHVCSAELCNPFYVLDAP